VDADSNGVLRPGSVSNPNDAVGSKIEVDRPLNAHELTDPIAVIDGVRFKKDLITVRHTWKNRDRNIQLELYKVTGFLQSSYYDYWLKSASDFTRRYIYESDMLDNIF
jgi:hypothetical protein